MNKQSFNSTSTITFSNKSFPIFLLMKWLGQHIFIPIKYIKIDLHISSLHRKIQQTDLLFNFQSLSLFIENVEDKLVCLSKLPIGRIGSKT